MIQFSNKASIHFLLSFVFIFLLSLVVSFFFPWWSIVFVAFGVTLLFPQKPLYAFLSAFLPLFILWGGLTIYLTFLNNRILETIVCKMFFNAYIPFLLNLLSAMIGGIVAGAGALVGSHLRAIVKSTHQIENVKISPPHIPPIPSPLTTVVRRSDSQFNTFSESPKEVTKDTPKIKTPYREIEIKKDVVVQPATQKKAISTPVVTSKKKTEIISVTPLKPKEQIQRETKTTLPPPPIEKPPRTQTASKPAVKKAIPKSSSPFKVPSIKEQTEKIFEQYKKRGEEKKS